MPVDPNKQLSVMPEDIQGELKRKKDRKLTDRALQMMRDDPESRKYFDADRTDIDNFMESRGNDEAKRKHGHSYSDEDMDAIAHGHRNGLLDANYRENLDAVDDDDETNHYVELSDEEKRAIHNSRARRAKEKQDSENKERVEGRKNLLRNFLGIKSN